MVGHEVIQAESPLALVAVGLALRGATLEGAPPALVLLDNDVVVEAFVPNVIIPKPREPARAARAMSAAGVRSFSQGSADILPLEVQQEQASTCLLVQLPGILDGGIDHPCDEGPVPFLATNGDPGVVLVLVKPVYPAHILVVDPNHIRLGDINVLLGGPREP